MASRKKTSILSVVAGAALAATVSAGAVAVSAPAFAQPLVGDGAVDVSQVKATVVAIDAETRQVTLKGPEGHLFTVKAGPQIKNFSQIDVGDTVTLTQTDAVVADIAKPEKGAEVGVQIEQLMGAAPAGDKPAGAVIDTIRLTGEIVRVDPDDATLEVKGPEGRLYTIQAKKDAQKQKVKALQAGDLVQVTFIQSTAIAVTK